jgi:hypothetical protein
VQGPMGPPLIHTYIHTYTYTVYSPKYLCLRPGSLSHTYIKVSHYSCSIIEMCGRFLICPKSCKNYCFLYYMDYCCLKNKKLTCRAKKTAEMTKFLKWKRLVGLMTVFVYIQSGTSNSCQNYVQTV